MAEPIVKSTIQWPTVSLGEICSTGGGDIQTGPFGSQLHAADYVPVGVPSVMPQNIGDNKIVEEGIARITPEDAKRLSRYLLRPEDIVYSRRGDVTRRALVSPQQSGWLCGTGCLRVRVGAAANAKFISYYLGHPEVREWIMRHAVGATMPNLNTTILSSLPVTIPPAADQASIADLLGALDEKIAVNDRIAATARALGTTKFVEAAQLSDAVDVRLSDMCVALTRGVAPKYTDDPDELIVINQKCVRGGRVSLEPARKTLAEKVREPKLLHRDDVLVNSTGVGTLGRVARWTFAERATVDSHVTIVRFNPERIDPVCGGFAMLAAQAEIEALGEGSTGQTELSRAQLGGLKIRVPSREVAIALRPQLDALEAKSDAVLAESHVLAELRDALLPPLMSGEIRVRDAEKVVEGAV
ncbi:restriction endonuclease subunit S [Nonomuraea sp. NPDC049625]|uniref:restriction endonuclease subunit S n=1 Tax=Nonomuraea sp. NPDC049625 TaxID=3155775 RepID=UPI00344416F7